MRFFHELGVCVLAIVLFCCLRTCNGQFVSLVVNASAKIAETDENFICATLDWWPPEKCDYGRCSWVGASLLNLDLENPVFAKALKAFSPLKIRLGGTLQDKLIYDVGPLSQPCHPFARDASKMFGFSKGCLTMDRWDNLNKFAAKTGSMVAFGLNALYGRYQISADGLWGGPWNSSNARSFIQYTVDHGYKIYAWEFGNELSGSGIGARVSATQYAADVIELHKILKDIYKHSHEKPLTVAPDGFFDPNWFQALLQETGSNVLNAVTRHIYNLGAGVDKHLTQKILNPQYLSREATKFRQMRDILQKYGPWASSWVGEAGGAYNSGKHLVSDAFVNSFWYLDQLGMSSTFNTKVYCRQSLIGGNYGLLNTTTFAPNPDYYSALLWHRLMGKGVLSVNIIGPPYVRVYLGRGIARFPMPTENRPAVGNPSALHQPPLAPPPSRHRSISISGNFLTDLIGAGNPHIPSQIGSELELPSDRSLNCHRGELMPFPIRNGGIAKPRAAHSPSSSTRRLLLCNSSSTRRLLLCNSSALQLTTPVQFD